MKHLPQVQFYVFQPVFIWGTLENFPSEDCALNIEYVCLCLESTECIMLRVRVLYFFSWKLQERGGMFQKIIASWQWCGMKTLEIGTFCKVRLIAPVDCQRPCMWSLYSLEKKRKRGQETLIRRQKWKVFFTKLFFWVRPKGDCTLQWQKGITFTSCFQKTLSLQFIHLGPW